MFFFVDGRCVCTERLAKGGRLRRRFLVFLFFFFFSGYKIILKKTGLLEILWCCFLCRLYMATLAVDAAELVTVAEFCI